MNADQKSESEAAVNDMNCMFSANQTDPMLPIVTINAFNTLNGEAILHNISVLYPIMATFEINNFRLPVILFATEGLAGT